MKIQVDGKLVYELNEIRKKVIQNDIPSEIFQEDMERRAKYIIEHKYEKCLERLKLEWEPKLRNRVSSVPTDPDALAELIFSQPDYKNRSKREQEEKVQEHRARTGQ
jgi:hypothetical protein